MRIDFVAAITDKLVTFVYCLLPGNWLPGGDYGKIFPMKSKKLLPEECSIGKKGIRDAQELLAGKWKFAVIAALHFEGKMRFMDLVRHIEGIAPKVLSNELKDLEMNQLVVRTVCNTRPITVEYELTEIGHLLEPVILAMAEWGNSYRKVIFKKKEIS